MSQPRTQGKNWAITSFELPKILDTTDINYIIGQEEQCPKTGRHHYQIYTQFIKKKYLTGVQKIFGKNGHYELAKGTPEQNIKYCSKPESRTLNGWKIEKGTPIGQGTRTDLNTIVADLATHRDLRKVLEDQDQRTTAVRYIRHLQVFLELTGQNHRNWEMNIEVWTGHPGTGKSKLAWELHPNAYSWNQSSWWERYRGQDTVIVDEFEPYKTGLSYINKLTDRYPLIVDVKNSSADFISKTIIFISNHPFNEWGHLYTLSFQRRIKKIYSFTDNVNFTRKLIYEQPATMKLIDEHWQGAPPPAPG